MANSVENISPKVLTMIHRQMKDMTNLSGIRLTMTEDTPATEVWAEIDGPVETPFEGGLFKMKLVITGSFPQQPPKAYFLTRIFHPNICTKGEVCVNTLKKDWDPANWSLAHILKVIRCLLIIPFPESALNQEAAKLFMESYEEYVENAKMMCQVYAKSNKSQSQAIENNENEGSSDANGETRTSGSLPSGSSSGSVLSDVSSKLKRHDTNTSIASSAGKKEKEKKKRLLKRV